MANRLDSRTGCVVYSSLLVTANLPARWLAIGSGLALPSFHENVTSRRSQPLLRVCQWWVRIRHAVGDPLNCSKEAANMFEDVPMPHINHNLSFFIELKNDVVHIGFGWNILSTCWLSLSFGQELFDFSYFIGVALSESGQLFVGLACITETWWMFIIKY